MIAADGRGLSGILVQAQGPAHIEATAFSGPDGEFQLPGLAPGTYRLAYLVDGRRQTGPQVVVPEQGAATRVELQLDLRFSEDVTVTDLREERDRRSASSSVTSIGRQAIEDAGPTHPGQIMARAPGVWVSDTGGEGHMTAIRQPLTTNPVYLFLEDGVPTRSTGFFNHNALYEVNVPQAEIIEVTEGPRLGALRQRRHRRGGQRADPVAVLGAGPDDDARGRRRRLASASWLGRGADSNGVRVDANLTHSDGWRDATDYAARAFTAALGPPRSARTPR